MNKNSIFIRILKKTVIGVFLAAVVCLAIFVIWAKVGSYAMDDTAKAYLKGNESVRISEEDYGCFFDGPGEEKAMIFYPGAYVEYTAYAPLMEKIAEQGVDCFLVEMPINLAFFGKNKASDILKNYSYEHYFMAGHSLGSVCAASYYGKHSDKFDGLILFAGYSTSDLSKTKNPILTIYGSEDKVLTMSRLEANRKKLPADSYEVVIEGGNHSQIGSYGHQKGDGEATISPEQQWDEMVTYVIQYITQYCVDGI